RVAFAETVRNDVDQGKDDEGDLSMNDEDFDSVISSLIAGSAGQKPETESTPKRNDESVSLDLDSILAPKPDDADDMVFSPTPPARNEHGDTDNDKDPDPSFIPLDLDSPSEDTDDITSDYCVFIPRDHLGDGDRELGANLMKMALFTFAELDNPPSALYLMNAGVKLTASFDTQVIEHFKALDALGVEILICGACADWYDLKDQIEVGEISNMYEILERMATHDKVNTL
ncbi:MAG TPA: sulfurtransferase-like selenium metabolism protein YedF, partial [Coriobacteriia bacterium]|nr:sulfurtransferase-like selenium metabolism protein YedF [Coriobacteriia bacterium]